MSIPNGVELVLARSKNFYPAPKAQHYQQSSLVNPVHTTISMHFQLPIILAYASSLYATGHKVDLTGP